MSVWRAVHDVKRGLSEISDVRKELGPGQLAGDVPTDRLEAARRSFRLAHGVLDRPFLVPLRYLPVVGRQLRSATSMAAAAEQVTRVGLGAARDVHAALAAPHHSPSEHLALLRRLDAIASDVDSRLRHVNLGPRKALIGALATRRTEFAADLTKVENGLDQARGATSALVDFLGNSRRYLVVAANNAEMRSGSGMFLQAGTLTTNGNGQFALTSIQSTEDLTLPPPGVPIAGDLAARWGDLQPNREWRNLDLSPQFDANAELAARMWAARTGEHVDGVLVIDVEALRQALTVTGPIGAAGITVNADSVEQFLLHDQYLSAGPSTPAPVEARRERLGVLAGAVLDTIQYRDADLIRLGPALARAAEGRHILAWAADPRVEQDWSNAGVGGRLGPDDLMLSIINRGADKLDPFQSVRADMTIRPAAGAPEPGASDVEVRVQVRNDTPDREPPYIAGSGAAPGASPGDYVGLIALDIPNRAGDFRLVGSLGAVAAGSDGPSLVLATPVTVKKGTSQEVTFRFRLAGTHGALRIVPSARLPATAWTAQGRSFDDSISRLLAW